MKRLLTITILLFSFSLAQAQNSPAHVLFEKYENQRGFTSVLISEYAFSLFSDVKKGQEGKFKEASQMITGIRILTVDDESKAVNAAQFAKELKGTFDLKAASYKPLMTVKSDGEEVLFYVKEVDSKIKEFVLLVQDPQSPVMILIEGEDIDINKLKALSGNTKIDVLDNIGNVK